MSVLSETWGVLEVELGVMGIADRLLVVAVVVVAR
jgi:hypothetical protein